MKSSVSDPLLTAIAPIIWGSTYLVTTQLLPGFSPISVAMLRALPAGLLLLITVRRLPSGIWWMRAFILGALNISVFLYLLFLAAYRLPGGVASTLIAAQPLIVVLLARFMLSTRLRPLAIVAALVGMGGVALLVLTSSVALDAVGVLASLAGATSMAIGTTLSRRWQPPVSPLTFTAWQLTAGGLLLVPVVLVFDRSMPAPTIANLLGLTWLALIGTALTYAFWFRGIARLPPAAVSSLLFLSPLTAVLLGWLVLGQSLSVLQIFGMAVVIGSIFLSQRANAVTASASQNTVQGGKQGRREAEISR